jgi:galactokinase
VDITNDQQAFDALKQMAAEKGLDVQGGTVRRSSSRFCLGVEHGDYNGTELFGVGTDRFIWMAYKPNGTNRVRLFSGNFPDDGVVSFESGKIPTPQSPEIAHSWARFPYGVDHSLRQDGFKLQHGFDAVLYGNIPGGGMSRSASLTLNLIITLLEVNHYDMDEVDDMKIIDMAQAVENEYIGSPCGQLDQIMIYFARAGMGTHYNPKDRSITYVPIGSTAIDFRIMVLDTGTNRPGLEKSTYAIRAKECKQFTSLLNENGYKITCLADIRDDALYHKILEQFSGQHPELCARLVYIYGAQKRFYEMLDAWKAGDIETVGAIFRTDGVGLRDDYEISGPELESMCDSVRTVDGVLGERMLGGGDKGASGALVQAGAVEQVRAAVDTAYPRSRPDFADNYAVHVCKVVDGIKVFEDAV